MSIVSPQEKRSLADLGHFASACAMLGVAALAIRWLPFRLIVRTMSWGGEGCPAAGSEELANSTVLAVRRASRKVPWRTVCFQEGLAVHWLLRSGGLPARLHYGIRPGDDRLSAHVWVTLFGRILIGDREAGSHACVATFPT